MTIEKISCQIPECCKGMRLDRALSLVLGYSRSYIKRLLQYCSVLVNNKSCKIHYILNGGEIINLFPTSFPNDEKQLTPLIAQNISIDVRYQDDSLLIINKQAGIVVHPAPGNPDHTIVNALLYHYPDLANLPRAGLIHRLDKDTSGLLIVARNLQSYSKLIEKLHDRQIERIYLAVVNGLPKKLSDTINLPVGRHPIQRQRMAVIPTGKLAITHFVVKQYFRSQALLHIQLETGRTHQIRVHMAHINLPLLGDPLYGKRSLIPKKASSDFTKTMNTFHRQALHAEQLRLRHPITGVMLKCIAEVPEDFRLLLDILSQDYISSH